MEPDSFDFFDPFDPPDPPDFLNEVILCVWSMGQTRPDFTYPDCELNVDPPVEGFGKFLDRSFSLPANDDIRFSWTDRSFWLSGPLDESLTFVSSITAIINTH